MILKILIGKPDYKLRKNAVALAALQAQ